MDTDEINTGGSIFWIFITLVSLASLIFIMIWSFDAQSTQGAILALIFFAMIASSAFLSRLKVFDWASWGDNTLSFTLGFLLWSVLGAVGGLSVLSVTQNQLFSTIASELPIMLEFTTSVFLIPIAEEMFWMIGLPFALISIMKILAKKFPLWTSSWLQIPILIIVGSITFAAFHVGKAFIGFIVAAIVFRSAMLFFVYAEQYNNIFEKVNLVAGFAIGAHIANNLLSFGVGNAWLTITSNFWPIGLLIVLFLLLMFISGIERLFDLISGSKEPNI